MGVWQGVAIDYLKYHSSLQCPTLLRPACRACRAVEVGGLQPSSTLLDTPRCTPMISPRFPGNRLQIRFTKPWMNKELIDRDSPLRIHLKQLRYQLGAFTGDELRDGVTASLNFAVQVTDVVIVEREEAAEEGIQQYAFEGWRGNDLGWGRGAEEGKGGGRKEEV
jgi:hypothetical protein